MTTREHLIFYTGKVRISGMLSAVDPASLEAGQFAVLENLAISRSKVSARWGCARLASAPVANASYRGSWAGYLAGTYLRVFAFRVSGATRIYTLSGSSWTERTAAGTRFTTDGFVDFAPFDEKGFVVLGVPFLKRSGLLMGNGADAPRIFSFDTNTLAFVLAAVATPTPRDSQLFASQPTPPGWFNIGNHSNTTPGGVDADFQLADSGTSTTSNELVFTFNAAHSINDQAGCSFGTTSTYEGGGNQLRLDEARQFHILIEDSINDPVFEYLKIEVADATPSYRIVFDATDSTNPKPIYTSCGGGVYLASFDLTPYNSNISGLTGLQEFRFTAVRKNATDKTARILAFMCGGHVDASAETAVSYVLSTTNVESARRVCAKYAGLLCGEVGGSRDRNIRLPVGEGLYFKNYVFYQNSTSSTSSDLAVFYRKDPEDEDYFAVAVASLSGASSTTLTKIENARADQKDYARKAPSDFCVVPPNAGTFAAASNRLYAGGIGGTTDQTSRVMISDEDYPLRFSEIPRDSDFDGFVDPDSGTSVSFPGEQVKKIVSLPGSLVGISPVAILTNKNVWRLEGIDALSLSRPTLLSPHGTLYPRTVAIQKGNLYFLDHERQPRVLVGGFDAQPLGIWRIEDLLQAGDPSLACGVVYREAYKLAYRAPAGTTNQHVLNYEERLDGWHRHAYGNPDWAGFLLEEVSAAAGSRLLGVTDTGEVFEVEQLNKLVDDQKTGSTTNDVSITITSGELHGELWQSLIWGRAGLLCDKAAGRTLTVTRSDPAWTANDGTPTGVVDCETDVLERAWRFDQTASTKQPCAIKAQACQLTLSGAWTPGKQLKGLFIEVGSGTGRPDVAA
jgi:hypothetical protein